MNVSPQRPFSFALVGAGKVGVALSRVLGRTGARCVGVTSRSRPAADAVAAELGCSYFQPSHPPGAEVFLLAVPDEALEDVAGGLDEVASPGALFLHVSGAFGLLDLASGRPVAALHPVQAFVSPEAGEALLPGTAWGVTCSAGLEPWAVRLVREDLGGEPVTVPNEIRPAWHAAAVMTSNGIAALAASGAGLLAALEVERPMDVLGPLARGTLRNVEEEGGSAAALTGPVVRGDRATVSRHLQALESLAPSLVDVYRQVTRLVVEAALAGERIDGSEAEAFLDLLEER